MPESVRVSTEEVSTGESAMVVNWQPTITTAAIGGQLLHRDACLLIDIDIADDLGDKV